MPKVNRTQKAETKSERYARFAQYIAARVPIGDALRLALSPDPFDRRVTQRAIPEFAARHGLNEKLVASAIYGTRRVTEDVCTALSKELGGTPTYWRELVSPARETAVAV